MSRSFRFVPPEPRPDVLTRPRLLRSLAGRWQHRVTSLTGGPGLGKTILLAQAIAENRLAPRGEDVWIGVEPHDADADRLARVVATAIANGGADEAGSRLTEPSVMDPVLVADAVWHRSPAEACLVLDDVHLLPAGSSGASWLGALVDALPANGHVVLASRSQPPVPLTRFGTQGELLRLAEEDLRFSDDELSGFASARGVDPQQLGTTGGWPAMAELAASVEQTFTGSYLWEEVLEPLGTMRRHVLAVLSDLGGTDDALASAAVGTPIELARALDGVPLVARGADGWYVAHGLWRSAPGLALPPHERAEIRRRAAEHLSERGRFDEAFSLLHGADQWDTAPAVLRSACLASDRLLSSRCRRRRPGTRARLLGRPQACWWRWGRQCQRRGTGGYLGSSGGVRREPGSLGWHGHPRSRRRDRRERRRDARRRRGRPRSCPCRPACSHRRGRRARPSYQSRLAASGDVSMRCQSYV